MSLVSPLAPLDKTVHSKSDLFCNEIKAVIMRASFPLPSAQMTHKQVTRAPIFLPIQRVRPVPFEPHPGRKEANEEIQN